MVKYVDKVRSAVGYDTPLSADHFCRFDMNNTMRVAKRLEPYRLGWMEDVIPREFTEQVKEISQAAETPISTGEDIYLKEGFIKLIDNHFVDITHPDLS